MQSIAVIGAGLSALTLARHLDGKAHVEIFEKSRGVSGRISTRRHEDYSFDHGAQFFRASTSQFQEFIAPLLEAGVVAPWQARFVEINNQSVGEPRIWDADFPHYVGVPSMSAIGKHLSQDLNIHLNTRVGSVRRHQGKWLLLSEQQDSLGEYDWLVCTAPARQSLDLLAPSVTLTRSLPNNSPMQACFSLMLGFAQPLELDFDAALVRGQDISWISVNSSKPGRGQRFCLLVHSTNKWADEHIDDDREQVISYLCQQTSLALGQDVSHAEHQAVHGWRYANIAKQEGPNHYFDIEHNLGLCGDWFIRGRIESAYTSGAALAQALAAALA